MSKETNTRNLQITSLFILIFIFIFIYTLSIFFHAFIASLKIFELQNLKKINANIGR